MDIRERLKGLITPEQNKPPFIATSLEELIQIAKLNGVKDVVSVQTLGREIPVDGQSDAVEHETSYTLFTKKGRCVIYDEVHGNFPKSETDELKDLATAVSRVKILASNGLLAEVANGWFGERNEPNKHSRMDIMHQIHMLDHAATQKIEAFPHPLLEQYQ